MNRVSIKTGSEGPRHDPYSYSEVTVRKQDGTAVTHHSGLAMWCKLDGQKLDQQYGDHYGEDTYEQFEKHAGIGVKAAMKAYDRMQRTCKKCGALDKIVDAVDGFPGETLYICQCGAIVSSDLNMSAII